LNHRNSLILGIVLAILLAIGLTGGVEFNNLAMARWVHIVSGVFWIGLLYYFNVAQVPALADAAADKGGPGGAGISKYVAPRALFWFRWAALATFNVWVLIWPNQKKVLGIVTATDAEKATARKVALLASRTNFVLSIPMLLCMASASHGLPL
jgi:uncharacterized membrane protein